MKTADIVTGALEAPGMVMPFSPAAGEAVAVARWKDPSGLGGVLLLRRRRDGLLLGEAEFAVRGPGGWQPLGINAGSSGYADLFEVKPADRQVSVLGAGEFWATPPGGAEAVRVRYLELAVGKAVTEVGAWREEGVPLAAHPVSPVRACLAGVCGEGPVVFTAHASGYEVWRHAVD
ncbi:hypothetical protein [Actinocorallia longicatena]|uniref:Uncharacterized protein n=1 Tax=Actinocorallia longicatena TaxID=111803 RepID=A0ABP6QDR9_9ACTN